MLGRKHHYTSPVWLARELVAGRGVIRPRQTRRVAEVFAAFFKKQFCSFRPCLDFARGLRARLFGSWFGEREFLAGVDEVGVAD